MPNFTFMRDLRGNNVPAKIKLPVATTQTIVPGDLLVLSSNQLIKATASVAAPVGIAAQTSTSAAAGTLIELYPIMPGQTWRCTAESAATAAVLGAALYDINNVAGQTIDLDDSSNGSIGILRTLDSTTDIEVYFSKGLFF